MDDSKFFCVLNFLLLKVRHLILFWPRYSQLRPRTTSAFETCTQVSPPHGDGSSWHRQQTVLLNTIRPCFPMRLLVSAPGEHCVDNSESHYQSSCYRRQTVERQEQESTLRYAQWKDYRRQR